MLDVPLTGWASVLDVPPTGVGQCAGGSSYNASLTNLRELVSMPRQHLCHRGGDVPARFSLSHVIDS